MLAEVAGKLEECDVFFPNTIKNPDGADPFRGKPDDPTSRSAEFALDRLHCFDRNLKVLFEQMFQNIHRSAPVHRAGSPPRYHRSIVQEGQSTWRKNNARGLNRRAIRTDLEALKQTLEVNTMDEPIR